MGICWRRREQALRLDGLRLLGRLMRWLSGLRLRLGLRLCKLGLRLELKDSTSNQYLA